VLGDGRLADAELGADGGGDVPGRQLPVGEQFQDPPPDRVAENVEGVHAPSISVMTYINKWSTLRKVFGTGQSPPAFLRAVPPTAERVAQVLVRQETTRRSRLE
jgi:hypothetical protein